MVSPAIQKIIIALFTILLIAFFGYRVFMSKSEEPIDPLNSVGTVIIGQDILDMVDKTRNLQIDKSLFSSALFGALVDPDIVLDPEPQGRNNPFAVIGSDSAVTVAP